MRLEKLSRSFPLKRLELRGAEGQRGKLGRWELCNATLRRRFHASPKWRPFCTEVLFATPHFRAPHLRRAVRIFLDYFPLLTCRAHCMACHHISPNSLSLTRSLVANVCAVAQFPASCASINSYTGCNFPPFPDRTHFVS